MAASDPYPGDSISKHPTDSAVAAVPIEVIRRAIESHGDGICITDAELDHPGPHIVYVNAAFTRITGYSGDEVVGSTPRVLQGPLTDRSVVGAVRTTLAAGQRFVGEAINYRKDGRPFVMGWTIDPAQEGRSATHFVAFQRDVTAETQLRRQHRALRHLNTRAVDLISAAQPDRADALALICEATDLFVLAGSARCVIQTRDGRIVVPEGVEGEPVIQAAAGTTEPAVVWRGATPSVVAPFRSVSGAIVIEGLDAASVSLVDLDLLSDLARAGDAVLTAIDDVHLRRREALAVQRVLLPPRTIDVPGFRVASRYVPSRRSTHAGGDWYDAVSTDWGVRLCVGDVVGKGMLAAAGMGLIRSHLRAQLAAGAPLAAVMAEADAFCRDEGIGATALVVDVWHDSGQMAAASCGHPPPIVVEARGARVVRCQPAPPLGAFRTPGPAPTATHGRLDHGEALVLYTDAAIDERHHDRDGVEALRAKLESVAPEVEACAAAVVATTEASRSDDLAVLAVRRT